MWLYPSPEDSIDALVHEKYSELEGYSNDQKLFDFLDITKRYFGIFPGRASTIIREKISYLEELLIGSLCNKFRELIYNREESFLYKLGNYKRGRLKFFSCMKQNISILTHYPYTIDPISEFEKKDLLTNLGLIIFGDSNSQSNPDLRAVGHNIISYLNDSVIVYYEQQLQKILATNPLQTLFALSKNNTAKNTALLNVTFEIEYVVQINWLYKILSEIKTQPKSVFLLEPYIIAVLQSRSFSSLDFIDIKDFVLRNSIIEEAKGIFKENDALQSQLKAEAGFELRSQRKKIPWLGTTSSLDRLLDLLAQKGYIDFEDLPSIRTHFFPYGEKKEESYNSRMNSSHYISWKIKPLQNLLYLVEQLIKTNMINNIDSFTEEPIPSFRLVAAHFCKADGSLMKPDSFRRVYTAMQKNKISIKEEFIKNILTKLRKIM